MEPKRILALATAILLLWCCSALAAQNPDARIYLDVDPPNLVHRVDPSPSATFDVYVCVDCFGQDGGTRGTAFLLVRTFGGFKLAQTALLGGLDFGDAEVDPGWTIAAGADCVYPDADGVVCVGVVTYLYTTPGGTLDLLPHGQLNPGTGREILDCNFESDFYCIYANLGVGEDPNPGQPDCECVHFPARRVHCEPQGGDNPVHPPDYWYDACAGWETYVTGFHVQVFDGDIRNYTDWSDPWAWTHCDSVRQFGEELWVSWCDPELENPLFWGDVFRFQFENPNPSAWGHWTMTAGPDPCHPFADVIASSWDYEGEPDGYGFRVHVPVAPTAVREESWGTIKALYTR